MRTRWVQRTSGTIGLALAAAAAVLVMTAAPEEASAIPVFARKYGLSCNSCHTMFPRLTKMGWAFRERGFRFSAGEEDLEMQGGPGKNVKLDEGAVVSSVFPFTVRTQILFSGAGPVEGTTAGGTPVPVMPGHQFGMLDGAGNNERKNWKFGHGELGFISAGSYDNFFWWMDANQNGIGMLEGGYYVNDLVKIRFGRIQTNVGYGLTMMNRRPLGYGTVDAAMMNGGVMLMMGDGIAIHGTTDGDTGVGTNYEVAYLYYGKNPTQTAQLANKTSQGFYVRLGQGFMDDAHQIGVYYFQVNNWSSDIMGGEAAMYMNMGGVARPMEFKKATRYGLDFAINYGEPIQLWGAFTFGTNQALSGQNLSVKAYTVAGEWLVTDKFLLGAKWDYQQAELQMMAAPKFKPSATQFYTFYAETQLAQNVQAIASVTQTKNLVTNMGMNLASTTLDSFTTGLIGVDTAF